MNAGAASHVSLASALFQKTRQDAFKRRAFEMVKEDFGHGAGISAFMPPPEGSEFSFRFSRHSLLQAAANGHAVCSAAKRATSPFIAGQLMVS